MSLILEALKKSEQQRRLGEAPTLGSPVVATRRRRSLLPVLAILIIAAAAMGWWLTRTTPAPATPPPAATTSAPVEAAPAPAPAAPSKSLPAPATAPANAGNHAPDRQRLTGYAVAQQKAEQEKRAAALANATHATMPPQPSAPIKPSPEPGTVAPPASSATTQTPAAADATAASATPPPAKTTEPAAPAATTPPNAKAENARTPATATAAAAKPAAENGGLPTVWDLPYSTRKDLPAIDLSMHVFSSDPKQRFVVIKGDRHVEGDELGQDLVLREIRQDGLVLEFKGQAFFFPRNGR